MGFWSRFGALSAQPAKDLKDRAHLAAVRRLASARRELAESREEAAELRDQLRRLRHAHDILTGPPERR